MAAGEDVKGDGCDLERKIKKGKPQRLAFFLQSIQFEKKSVAGSAAARGPEVEEIQSLNFHQPDIDKKKIYRHDTYRDEEPDDRFSGDKFFLLFGMFHFLITPFSGFLKRFYMD